MFRRYFILLILIVLVSCRLPGEVTWEYTIPNGYHGWRFTMTAPADSHSTDRVTSFEWPLVQMDYSAHRIRPLRGTVKEWHKTPMVAIFRSKNQ